MKSLLPQIEGSRILPSQFRAFSEDIGIYAKSLRKYEDSELKAIQDHKLHIYDMIEGFNTAIDEQSPSGCSTILTQIGGVFLPRSYGRHGSKTAVVRSTSSSTSTLAREHYHPGTNPHIGAKRERVAVFHICFDQMLT